MPSATLLPGLTDSGSEATVSVGAVGCPPSPPVLDGSDEEVPPEVVTDPLPESVPVEVVPGEAAPEAVDEALGELPVEVVEVVPGEAAPEAVDEVLGGLPVEVVPREVAPEAAEEALEVVPGEVVPEAVDEALGGLPVVPVEDVVPVPAVTLAPVTVSPLP
jgi:hypothetical protein